MAETVAKMTPAELQEMIENAVEQKLVEILGDPDEGLVVRGCSRSLALRPVSACRSWGRPRRPAILIFSTA